MLNFGDSWGGIGAGGGAVPVAGNDGGYYGGGGDTALFANNNPPSLFGNAPLPFENAADYNPDGTFSASAAEGYSPIATRDNPLAGKQQGNVTSFLGGMVGNAASILGIVSGTTAQANAVAIARQRNQMLLILGALALGAFLIVRK